MKTKIPLKGGVFVYGIVVMIEMFGKFEICLKFNLNNPNFLNFPNYPNNLILKKAWAGFEPAYDSFANCCLTTWPPGRKR